MQELIKVQKDYYLTEVSLNLPSTVEQMHGVLKANKTNGKMLVQYNQGSLQCVNIEQRTKITEAQAAKIRELLQIGEKVL